MLEKVRRFLGYQLTIAELIGLGPIIGTPDWSGGNHLVDDKHRASAAHARRRPGGVVSRLDSVLAVLLFANVCMT